MIKSYLYIFDEDVYPLLYSFMTHFTFAFVRHSQGTPTLWVQLFCKVIFIKLDTITQGF